jgi:hypothetical protein
MLPVIKCDFAETRSRTNADFNFSSPFYQEETTLRIVQIVQMVFADMSYTRRIRELFNSSQVQDPIVLTLTIKPHIRGDFARLIGENSDPETAPGIQAFLD